MPCCRVALLSCARPLAMATGAGQCCLTFHLTRCLRTLRARLQSSHSVAARGAREGPWSGQPNVVRPCCCRFTTYRHRFARAAPAPRAWNRVDVHRPSSHAAAKAHAGSLAWGPIREKCERRKEPRSPATAALRAGAPATRSAFT